jgi:hypothetical protein
MRRKGSQDGVRVAPPGLEVVARRSQRLRAVLMNSALRGWGRGERAGFRIEIAAVEIRDRGAVERIPVGPAVAAGEHGVPRPRSAAASLRSG